MNTLDFGQSMPSTGNTYLRVKQKGDMITFRPAQNPVYTGKHFIETATGWDVQPCPRINDQDGCDMCELFFEAKAELKKLEEAKDPADKETIKGLKNETRKYSVAVSFYFPVLNRDTKKFGILQVTQGVRNKMNAAFEAGTKVLDRDWVLRNTGSSNPGEIYFVAPIDSAESKPLDEEEEIEYKKAQEFDLSTLNEGGNSPDEIEE